MNRSMCFLAVLLAVVSSLPIARALDLTVLHPFADAGTDGSEPSGSLTLGGSTLYGMTRLGYSRGDGSVFSIGLNGTNYTVLHVFDRTLHEGYQPRGNLTLSGSTLYGLTEFGGTNDRGTLFSMDTDGGNFATLHSFTGTYGDGVNPEGSLLRSGSKLYGTTLYGGATAYYRGGTIFSYDTISNEYNILHSFTGASDDATQPWGNLILVGSTLYGMTSDGGAANWGTIFSLGTDGSHYDLMHSFTGTTYDGANPQHGDLTLAGSTLYGMDSGGGTGGVLFSYDTASGGVQHLYSFDNNSGKTAYGSVTLQGSTLYGMTSNRGSGGYGTVFSMTLTAVWNGAAGGDDNWTNAANWSGTVPTSAFGLKFGPLAPGGHASNFNNAAGSPLFGGITFVAGAATYDLAGNAVTLAGDVTNQSGVAQSISLDIALVDGGGTFDTGANDVTITGVLSGAGMALSKRGTGTLILDPAAGKLNTYTGGTNVQAGSLVFANALALPTRSDVTVGPSGVVIFRSGYTGPISAIANSPVPVPEPGTLALLAVSAVGLLACMWRWRRAA